jgi:hypothetical protein
VDSWPRQPREAAIEQIQHDLQDYAIQFPHRALIDGAEVAMAGAEVKQRRDAPDDLLAS